MTEYTYERPYLYPKQLAAIFSPQRYALIEASTKAGKTVACIVWLTEQALQGKPGQNFWWVAPSYNQAKIAFTRLGHAFTPGFITENKTDMTSTLPNGAIIWFKTGEMPDKLYGEDVFAAVVDEASRCREEAWIALRSTITATGAPVRIIGNVRGRRNWFYRMARVAEKGHPAMSYAKLTVLDAIEAGVFKAEEAEDAAGMMNEATYRELYMAEAADDGGNPFGGDQVIELCEDEVLWTHEPVAWGWDLAKSIDWTVGIALDQSGRCCRFYRWQKKPWPETIQQIRELVGKVPTLIDQTGVGDPILDDLQRGGLGKTIQGLKFTNTSKQQLMEGLATAIQAQSLSFPHNPVGIELMSFEYLYTRTGVAYSAPQGEHDDCVCALALAWRQFHKAPPPDWYTTAISWIPPRFVPIFQR